MGSTSSKKQHLTTKLINLDGLGGEIIVDIKKHNNVVNIVIQPFQDVATKEDFYIKSYCSIAAEFRPQKSWYFPAIMTCGMDCIQMTLCIEPSGFLCWYFSESSEKLRLGQLYSSFWFVGCYSIDEKKEVK